MYIFESRHLNISGAISDDSDVMTYTGFYYSVAMLKKQPFRPFDLITPVETIDKTNSFQLAQASKLLNIYLFIHGCSVFIFISNCKYTIRVDGM